MKSTFAMAVFTLALLALVAGCSSSSNDWTPAASNPEDAAVSDVVDAAVDAVADSVEPDTLDASDAKSPVCEPGKQESCACPGGYPGVQACKDDGSGWLPCACLDAGKPDVAVDTGFDTGADAVDTGIVDAHVEAEASVPTISCPGYKCLTTIECKSTTSPLSISYESCCGGGVMNVCGISAPDMGLGCFDIKQVQDTLSKTGQHFKCDDGNP